MHNATEAEVARLRAMETYFEQIIEAVDSWTATSTPGLGARTMDAVAAYRAAGKGQWARKIIETIDVVFDGAPGPEGGRFIEVERLDGTSLKVGEWVARPDGRWALRLRAVTL